LWEIDDDWTAAEEHFSAAQLGSLTQQLSPTATATARPFFLIRSAQNDDSVEVSPVQDFAAFFADVPEQLVRTCNFESPWDRLELDDDGPSFSERSVSSIRRRKLPHLGGLCAISLRTFARCTQRGRRQCGCYAGVAMQRRVVSESCAAVQQRARRNRAQSGGKRMYRVNLARESPTWPP
jgi:hypothetical protein